MKPQSIYDCNPASNKDDARKLVTLLPVIVDWLTYNHKKPLQWEEACRQFQKHKSAFFRTKKKEELNIKKTRVREEKVAKQYCQRLVEKHLQVILSGEDIDSKVIDWNKIIRDPVTNSRIGTPREILSIDFRRKWNPKTQQPQYLEEIRNLFDGFERDFSFDRPPTLKDKLREKGLIFQIEEAPFSKKNSKKWRYNLTLKRR